MERPVPRRPGSDVRLLVARVQRVMDGVCGAAGARPVQVALADTSMGSGASSRFRLVTVDPGYAVSLPDGLLAALLAHELGHLEGARGEFTDRWWRLGRVAAVVGVVAHVLWLGAVTVVVVASSSAPPAGRGLGPVGVLGPAVVFATVTVTGLGLVLACRRDVELAADRYAVDVVGAVPVLAQLAAGRTWAEDVAGGGVRRRGVLAGAGRRWGWWLRDRPDEVRRVRAVHAYVQQDRSVP